MDDQFKRLLEPMEQKTLDMIRKLYDISRLSKSKRHSKNINPRGIMKNLKSHSKQPLGLKRSLLCKKNYIGECGIIPKSLICSQNFWVRICEKCCSDGMTSLKRFRTQPRQERKICVAKRNIFQELLKNKTKSDSTFLTNAVH